MRQIKEKHREKFHPLYESITITDSAIEEVDSKGNVKATIIPYMNKLWESMIVTRLFCPVNLKPHEYRFIFDVVYHNNQREIISEFAINKDDVERWLKEGVESSNELWFRQKILRELRQRNFTISNVMMDKADRLVLISYDHDNVQLSYEATLKQGGNTSPSSGENTVWKVTLEMSYLTSVPLRIA